MTGRFVTVSSGQPPFSSSLKTLILYHLHFRHVISHLSGRNTLFEHLVHPNNKSAGYAVVAFIYLFSPAYNLGMNGNLGLYITEILPYHLPLRGMAIFQFWTLGFIALSTFAIPVGLADMTWRFYCIFIGWVVVEFGVVWWLFPETKGPSLEEIAILFDGPGRLDPERIARDIKDEKDTSVQVVEDVREEEAIGRAQQ